jgi:hypothetical protein
MIEGIMETILYASKVLDNQRWNVGQGMIGSKILEQSKHSSRQKLLVFNTMEM